MKQDLEMEVRNVLLREDLLKKKTNTKIRKRKAIKINEIVTEEMRIVIKEKKEKKIIRKNRKRRKKRRKNLRVRKKAKKTDEMICWRWKQKVKIRRKTRRTSGRKRNYRSVTLGRIYENLV